MANKTKGKPTAAEVEAAKKAEEAAAKKAKKSKK